MHDRTNELNNFQRLIRRLCFDENLNLKLAENYFAKQQNCVF